MSSEIIDLSIEKYDIQKNWIEKIAPKYLDVSNINHLKVGLFGYLNEIMATELRNSTFHRNFLYDETFLNTASMTKSIYNKAKSYNYEVGRAIPSSCTILLSIKQDSIFEYGIKEIDKNGYYTGNYKLILDKNNIFTMKNYQFMAEDNIIITATKLKSGSYSYTAKYDFTDTNNNSGRFSNSTNPYISLWVDRDESIGDIVTIRIDIYQIQKKVTTFENYSSDLSDSLFFNVEYINNLADFKVVYTENNESNIINGYFNDAFTPVESKYFYYSFDNQILTIYFSGLPTQFKPAINSKLEITTYNTLGIEGVINYEGEIKYNFTKNESIEYTISLVTKPQGGRNMPTKLEVKQDLIYEFLSRDNLVTEYDLNQFFNKLIKKEVVNSSKLLFIKKRDDVLKRCYGAFLLLRDRNGFVLPTNTINCTFLIDVNNDYGIPAGQTIVYDDNEFVVWDDESKKLIDESTVKNFYKFQGDKHTYIEYDSTYDSFKDKLKIHSDGFYKIFNERQILNEEDYTYSKYVLVDDACKELIINKKDSEGNVIPFDGTLYRFLNKEKAYILYKDEYKDIKKNLTIETLKDPINSKFTDNVDNYKIKYILPFAMYYYSDAPQRVMFVENTINREYYFNFSFVNANIPAEFIISSLYIARDSISFNKVESSQTIEDQSTGGSDVYEISSNGLKRELNKFTYDKNGKLLNKHLMTYQEIDEIHEYTLSFSLDSTYDKDLILGNSEKGIEKEVICRCLIKNDKGKYVGYFDFECSEVDRKIVYATILRTNDVLDSHRNLTFVNCVRNLDIEQELIDKNSVSPIGTMYKEFYMSEKMSFEIVFLVKDSYYDAVLPEPINYMQDLEGYTVSTIFKGNTDISFFTIVNDILNPTLEFKPRYACLENENLLPKDNNFSSEGIFVTNLPVIGRHYFNSYTVYKDFFNIFNIYYDVLMTNFDKLENNTNVEIKFYNTYGISRHFSSYSTDVYLDLTIKLADSYTAELDLKIKKSIVEFVSGINDTENKVFAISNLIKTLENTFPDIRYIECEGINGEEYQKITYDYHEIDKLNKEQLINYIPEFLNVHIGPEAYAEGDNNYVTGITIKYK